MSGILKKRYQYEHPTETDSYLAPPGKTLSYLLCNEDFIVLFTKHFTCADSFSNPAILYQYCIHLLAQSFPLSEKQILQALVEDKPVYWENVCYRLKILTESVTKTAIKTYKSDTIHDSLTYLPLFNASFNSKQFSVHISLMLYIIRTIRYINS